MVRELEHKGFKATLGELGLFSLKKRRLKGNTAAFLYLQNHKHEREKLFLEVYIRGNRYKAQQETPQLRAGRKLFTVRLTKHWVRLPREAVRSLSFEIPGWLWPWATRSTFRSFEQDARPGDLWSWNLMSSWPYEHMQKAELDCRKSNYGNVFSVAATRAVWSSKRFSLPSELHCCAGSIDLGNMTTYQIKPCITLFSLYVYSEEKLQHKHLRYLHHVTIDWWIHVFNE